MKLLIIEDEKALSDAIVEYLTSEGYGCETALNFWTADEKVTLYDYDCVLVDISLPDGSGFEVIKELKKRKSEAGIIIISAKNSLDDKIMGLEIGADDYMTKPFHLSELNARIKSIIRRRNFSGQTEIVANEICIIPEEALVKVNHQPIELTKKEYDLLLYLLSNKNRVLTKESIAEHLWGDDMDTSDSFDFIYTHIKNLRKKITEKGGNDYLKTIYGMGYKFQI
ncbi:MAG: response regulator transcription factor [Ignavibacteria bacterium]|nr:response regulator transcription factor [Ignavibacteria bacterium]